MTYRLLKNVSILGLLIILPSSLCSQELSVITYKGQKYVNAEAYNDLARRYNESRDLLVSASINMEQCRTTLTDLVKNRERKDIRDKIIIGSVCASVFLVIGAGLGLGLGLGLR